MEGGVSSPSPSLPPPPAVAPPSATFPVFIDSSLGTHFALIVSPDHTVADLKRNIRDEHALCFPETGEIIVASVKVKRRGAFYHLADSMPLRTAFNGIKGTWFLHIDIIATSVWKHEAGISENFANMSGEKLQRHHELGVEPSCGLLQGSRGEGKTDLHVDQVEKENREAEGEALRVGAADKTNPARVDAENLSDTNAQSSHNEIRKISEKAELSNLHESPRPLSYPVNEENDKEKSFDEELHGQGVLETVALGNTAIEEPNLEQSLKENTSCQTKKMSAKPDLQIPESTIQRDLVYSVEDNKQMEQDNTNPAIDSILASYHGKAASSGTRKRKKSAKTVTQNPDYTIQQELDQSLVKEVDAEKQMEDNMNPSNGSRLSCSSGQAASSGVLKRKSAKTVHQNPEYTIQQELDQSLVKEADYEKQMDDDMNPSNESRLASSYGQAIATGGQKRKKSAKSELQNPKPTIQQEPAHSLVKEVEEGKQMEQGNKNVGNESKLVINLGEVACIGSGKQKRSAKTELRNPNSAIQQGLTESLVKEVYEEKQMEHDKNNPANESALNDLGQVALSRRQKRKKSTKTVPRNLEYTIQQELDQSLVKEVDEKEMKDNVNPRNESSMAGSSGHAASTRGQKRNKSAQTVPQISEFTIQQELDQSLVKEVDAENKMEDNVNPSYETSLVSSSGQAASTVGQKRKKSAKTILPNSENIIQQELGQSLAKEVDDEKQMDDDVNPCNESSLASRYGQAASTGRQKGKKSAKTELKNPKPTIQQEPAHSLVKEGDEEKHLVQGSKNLGNESNLEHDKKNPVNESALANNLGQAASSGSRKRKESSKAEVQNHESTIQQELANSLVKEDDQVKQKEHESKNIASESLLASNLGQAVSIGSPTKADSVIYSGIGVKKSRRQKKTSVKTKSSCDASINHDPVHTSEYQNVQESLENVSGAAHEHSVSFFPNEDAQKVSHGDDLNQDSTRLACDSHNKDEQDPISAQGDTRENDKELGNSAEMPGKENVNHATSRTFTDLNANSSRELPNSDNDKANFFECFLPKVVQHESVVSASDIQLEEAVTRKQTKDKSRRKKKSNMPNVSAHDIVSHLDSNQEHIMLSKSENIDCGNHDLAGPMAQNSRVLTIGNPNKCAVEKVYDSHVFDDISSGMFSPQHSHDSSVKRKLQKNKTDLHLQGSLTRVVQKEKTFSDKSVVRSVNNQDANTTTGLRYEVQNPANLNGFDKGSDVIIDSNESHFNPPFVAVHKKKLLADQVASSDSTDDTPIQTKRYRVAVRKVKVPGKVFGKVLNKVKQERTLPASSGPIFDGSTSGSSEDELEMSKREATRRTDSDYSSAPITFDGDIDDAQTTGFRSAAQRKDGKEIDGGIMLSQSVPLDSFLRSTSSYKKAKILASQSQAEDSEIQHVEVILETQPECD